LNAQGIHGGEREKKKQYWRNHREAEDEKANIPSILNVENMYKNKEIFSILLLFPSRESLV
jgi:hypothetical protein